MNFPTPEQAEQEAVLAVSEMYASQVVADGRQRTVLSRLTRRVIGECATPCEIAAVVTGAAKRLRDAGFNVPPIYTQHDFSL